MNPAWSLAAIASGGRLVTRLRTRGPTLYLTFDDGPHPRHTAELLDLLRRFRAQVTFFVLGENVEAYPDVVRAVIADGHAVGNHSYSHPRMATISYRKQRREIDRTDELLMRHDPRNSRVFRPPHGKMSLGLTVDCLLGTTRVALWSRDSFDYKLPPAEIVSALTQPEVQSGDIVLFHDDQPVAREALTTLLPAWTARGFSFAALA